MTMKYIEQHQSL